MRFFTVALSILFLCNFLSAQEKQKQKVFTNSPDYYSIISTFEIFDKQSDLCLLKTYGTTDVGKPLHLFILSKDKTFEPAQIKQQGKAVLLLNNGIHPGEPDGIDASIELARNILADPKLLPDNLVICIVPVFNVDGCLNRGNCSRANQCGPLEYGFRGNAKNLDLNRDFIKADAQNTQTLQRIFQEWKPDFFVDTHVSNGADYQYTMTLIATQRNKLHPVLSAYMDKELVPSLYRAMELRKEPMCPYVDTRGETPESGIVGFLETPRFATGYAALFNCIGFVTEAHMLKPYDNRVKATLKLLEEMVRQFGLDAKKVVALHAEADRQVASQKTFMLNWKLDTAQFTWIDFRGYEARYKTSEVSSQPRLYYDLQSPYTKKIKFYNTYVPSFTVTLPDYYVIPQAWLEVVERLRMNGVKMSRLLKDTTIYTAVYYITTYETGKFPYEGHYLHRDVHTRSDTQAIRYYRGDFIIPTNQPANRYLAETLEPRSGDSFFAWNFFDGILQQKEWFSDYVFEEKADSLVRNDPALKKMLEDERKRDTAFAKNAWAQLNFVYQHSAFKERSHNRYPVGRLNGELRLGNE
ncbi:MAG TPA: M14 family metallopeptidase [Bacteroidia bacterium]|nr:M14 family metallopeptidase [Bacteroidia bacterium]